jgi:tetratricopeptide (TPR) repeat protein
LFAGAALLVLVILAVLARTTLWLSFAVFWFIVALAPTSSFAPILDVAVERRLYLSGIAMVFFWFFLLSSIPRRKITIFLLPLLFFSINTIQRNTVYKDGVTLWRDSSSKSLREPRPHFNCAKALKKYGYPDEAIIEYQKAMAIGYSPYNHEIHNGLGVIYMEKGLYRKAIEEFHEAIRVKYDFDFPHNNLASAYLKLGETEKAAEALSKAISINPDNMAARNNLGVIYAQKGLYEKAYNEFKAILDKNPMEIEIKKNLEKLEAILASERGDK